MKTKNEIEREIMYAEQDLERQIEKHSQLSQIDMLSGEGSEIRAKINKLKGKIETLNWVLY